MKFLALLASASILLVSACATSTSDAMHGQMLEAVASSVRNYRCESGQTLAVTYSSADAATVHYKGYSYHLQVAAVSGSGARYVGGVFEWWTKGFGPGSEGTLFRHLANGTSGEKIERCTAS